MAGVLALLALLAAPSLHAVELRDDLPSLPLWPAASVLIDETGQRSLSDLLAQPALLGPPPGSHGTLGVLKHPAWLRVPLQVAPDSDEQWVLDIDYPVLQRIEVYLVASGRTVQQETLGSQLPYAMRPLLARSHAVALRVAAGERYELFLRIQTRGAMVLPLTLNKPRALVEREMGKQLLQGMLTGLALCLILYSVAQWMHLREALFLQYAVLIIGSLLFSLHLFGTGSQYLWRDNAWIEAHAAGLSALMAATGSFLFISQALWGHRPRSGLLRAMRAGAVACVVLAVLYALDLLTTAQIAGIVTVLGPLPALMGLPGAVQRTRRGDPIGSSLLLAWLVYFVATTVVIGVIRGWVPVNFWTLNSFQLGATLDMLLFMRVLGLRTKALRNDALAASRERDALHSLAHTDPLTGLPNRRGLGRALEAALSTCTAHQLLAVYVMDLDGFKPVNDSHGHDMGDDLLVAVAQRLRGQVRHSDLVARLGGDEFVIMTPRLQNTQQAQELGDKLLQAFREPFSLGGLQVQVGLTIGYAIAPLDSRDGRTLLKQADAAMYSGKQSGKFCVRRAEDPPART